MYCVFKRLKKNYPKNNLGVIKPGGPYKHTSDDIDKLIFDKRAKIKNLWAWCGMQLGGGLAPD